MRSLPALQLRRLLLLRSLPTPPPPPLQTLIPSPSTKPTHHFLSPPHFSLLKSFSSSSTHLDESQSALSISSLLLQPNSTFPPFTPTPSLLLAVLNLSPDAGRAVLSFHQSLIQNPNFHHSDEILSYFVDYFGRRKDFKAAHDVILSAGRDVPRRKTLTVSIDRLVRAGRPAQAVTFFEKMEEEYGIVRDKEGLRLVVEKLCENGFASNAEKMVKGLVNEFFPDEGICDLLIKGWCVDGKLEEARRLAEEM